MQKAKFLRNIALLLLPAIIYFSIFIAFEPNNYFGLKAQADGTDIMATLRQYQVHPQNRVIIGDSRMAKLNPVLVQETTGRFYANLAFGGASLKEQLDVLDWVEKQNPNLQEAVFMLSFYNLNTAYNHDRKIIAAMNNPLRYMTNLGYNINMLTNLLDHLLPGRQVGATGETTQPGSQEYVDFTSSVTGETVSMRKTIASHITEMTPRTKNWQLNEAQFQRLLDTVQRFEEKGIRLILVLPPASDEVMEHIVDAFGIRQPMMDVFAQLNSAGATVLDYEFSNRELMTPDDFYDGFHLDEQRGLPRWTRLLFTAINKEVAAGGA